MKEPIAWKGRNKSRAGLHCDSCYLPWHGVVSPVGGADGRLRLLVLFPSTALPHSPSPSYLFPVPSPSPSLYCFLPSLVTHLTGAWHLRTTLQIHLEFSSYQTSTAVLCDLAKSHDFSVPSACMYYIVLRNVRSLSCYFPFVGGAPRGSWNGLKVRSWGFTPVADSSSDSSMWKGEGLDFS